MLQRTLKPAADLNRKRSILHRRKFRLVKQQNSSTPDPRPRPYVRRQIGGATFGDDSMPNLLERTSPMVPSFPCPRCGKDARFEFSLRDENGHEAHTFECSSC